MNIDSLIFIGDVKMNFGILDLEMTCDGRQEGKKFIDDGRMKHCKREIISVGFIVVDEKYNIKSNYKSFVKPFYNKILTDYCKNLTGINQKDVDSGKKCNNAFRDIRKICEKFSIEKIITFGNADKAGIIFSIKFCKKAKEKVENMYVISSKIIDIKPKIIEKLNYKNNEKGIGLLKIVEILKIKNKKTNHNALNDVLILRKICKKINLEI